MSKIEISTIPNDAIQISEELGCYRLINHFIDLLFMGHQRPRLFLPQISSEYGCLDIRAKNLQDRGCTPVAIRLRHGKHAEIPVSDASSIVVSIAVGLERTNFKNSYADVFGCNQPDVTSNIVRPAILTGAERSNAWEFARLTEGDIDQFFNGLVRI